MTECPKCWMPMDDFSSMCIDCMPDEEDNSIIEQIKHPFNSNDYDFSNTELAFNFKFMKYKIIRQLPYSERDFVIQDTEWNTYNVDIYSSWDLKIIDDLDKIISEWDHSLCRESEKLYGKSSHLFCKCTMHEKFRDCVWKYIEWNIIPCHYYFNKWNFVWK